MCKYKIYDEHRVHNCFSTGTHQQPLSQEPGTQSLNALCLDVADDLWQLSHKPAANRSKAKEKPSQISSAAHPRKAISAAEPQAAASERLEQQC